MQIILSSAKLINEKVEWGQKTSVPSFLSTTETIIQEMRNHSPETLEKLLKTNRKIASQNWLRYQHFFDEDTPEFPAVLTYNGQVYKHLQAEQFSKDTIKFGQQHLWITSFLYGLLRPLDGIHPYRMEGTISLDAYQGASVFNVWKPLLTQKLLDAVKQDDGVLIHLSTEEYQQLFDWNLLKKELHIIQPKFMVEKGGRLKNVTVYAKTCRGAMTRFLLERKSQKAEDLFLFKYEGFEYAPEYGDDTQPHFILRT